MPLTPTSRARLTSLAISVSVLALAAACAGQARLPSSATYGPNPTIGEPQKALIPTINARKAVGWPSGDKPIAAAGLKVEAFAGGLDHPRWLYVLPNGDVLVAETNAPPKPEDGKGIKGAVMKAVMANAGAAAPTANRISLLRDADGDGVAETKTAFLTGLNSPFGMALVGNTFYVANSDAVVSFPYTPGATAITAPATRVTDLPAGPINHHWTKNIVASPDGTKLYATVGSNSNVGENGLDKEEGRAAIWEIDLATGQKRLFATGLRNPNGMDFEPSSGMLWTAVNERDEIGHDLVPDYMTSVKDGGFYGWPYSYWGRVDDRVKPQDPAKVAAALTPDYALGAHTASLGLTFYRGGLLGQYRGGALIGQHGSWNRDPVSGYKVVFVPFSGGKPSGPAQDVLTGFLDKDVHAKGRPVGVVVDRAGALLVADDVGNVIWRVTPAA
ncbi:MAG: sorbosone dehydrogenase family protein [Caulobacteraceae bacterium]|nr:MAG: sorbosone dehydrogenase family protein [Caulobacteraceae bacterium]